MSVCGTMYMQLAISWCTAKMRNFVMGMVLCTCMPLLITISHIKQCVVCKVAKLVILLNCLPESANNIDLNFLYISMKCIHMLIRASDFSCSDV